MKKFRLKLPELVYLQKTRNSILLKQQEILKAFSVLTAGLLIVYLAAFKILDFIQAGTAAILIIASPLLLALVLVRIVYSKRYLSGLFIITWLLPALLVFVSLCYPNINYSRILLVFILVTLLVNNSKRKRVIGFCWLTASYAFIQLRFFYAHTATENSRHLPLEIIMLPVFCLTAFIILSRIKKEFTVYQKEIRQQKEKLEQKNASLESLVSFSEQQRDKLKRTVLLKEKLISIISHDVRVPINSFKFLIDNYEKGYIPEKMLLDGIIETRKDLVQMDNMVLDLVNWSRKGKEDTEQSWISVPHLHDILESVLSIYCLCAKNKKIDIASVIDIPENRCLAIPRREIEIIMRNLLSNAIKFSQPGSKVIVSLKPEEGNSSSLAALVVKDFGTGIHPSVLERLNGNKMISSTGTLDEVGLGIGLSIVFDVINDNSLGYDIQSELNKGTEFSVSIPLTTC
ncbi:MAG: HAMP domain-containing sensor histidine kinase [Bacteroidota bacterium]